MVEQVEQDICFFFVYGTLKRGLRNECVWPCDPIQVQQSWVRGTLFDRPEYPALKAGNDRVLGETWSFHASQMKIVLPAIDHLEGTDGNSPDDLYHRVIVDVFDMNDRVACSAFTYHFVREPENLGFTRLVADEAEFVAWPVAK